ncbi:MAG TPA: polyprenol monophosphomannose synthase [Lacipirellulaceae bacterium]|jgi:dolichol-phosphate mannosyltransferase|nr:polyprenol monophosphomannose synthase [Lacipirellulaceae bacterium]
MADPRVLVALATYNEIENLPSLVDEIRRVLPEADVLVIDDNSPDGTGKWCDKRAAADSHVQCLHRPGKQGLGSATIAAMWWAIDHSYDVLVTMDADWSHDPQHLPELVDATTSADVSIGSRYCRGGAIEGWPLARRVMSRVMNGLSRAVLRFPINDASGAFRAYRVVALRSVDVSRIQAIGYSYLEETIWLLHRGGATFAEIPITFHQRRAGTSKINMHEAFDKVTTLARLALRRS